MTLVLGSEAHGVSAAARAEVDVEVAVPMAPPVESLNVAVTAGIVMYRMRGL
jgi:TrmH family RNA methyltransferase